MKTLWNFIVSVVLWPFAFVWGLLNIIALSARWLMVYTRVVVLANVKAKLLTSADLFKEEESKRKTLFVLGLMLVPIPILVGLMTNLHEGGIQMLLALLIALSGFPTGVILIYLSVTGKTWAEFNEDNGD